MCRFYRMVREGYKTPRGGGIMSHEHMRRYNRTKSSVENLYFINLSHGFFSILFGKLLEIIGATEKDMMHQLYIGIELIALMVLSVRW